MSDIPQIHEWIVDGVNGYLCSPRDPDVLTEKILNIFKNDNNVVVTFVKENLIRVSQDANFSKNREPIKSLVYKLARHNED